MANSGKKEADTIAEEKSSLHNGISQLATPNGTSQSESGQTPARNSGSQETRQKCNQEKLLKLLQTFHQLPLIPNETALNLLKIQSKYVSSHPCMCTSRFRHTLHQLDEEHHQDLDNLCSQLPYLLRIEDSADESSRYDSLITPVFGDLATLQKKSDDWLIRSGQQKYLGQDLAKCLNKIIARLVTDYRAIFAIEVEFSRSFEKSDDEFNLVHNSSHEHHRKRHEEADCCPEEIKQMKVACAELTLECKLSSSSSDQQRSTSGPKFCLKSLTSQEIPEKDNSILRHPVEHVLEDSRSSHRKKGHHAANNVAKSSGEKGPLSAVVKAIAEVISSDSTPASSDAEQPLSPASGPLKIAMRFCQRKRKERRDSIGEVQDKKFSKSSSDVFNGSSSKNGDDDQGQKDCAKNYERRAHSTNDFVDFVQSSCQEIHKLSTSSSESNISEKKCIFYVSDDEAPDAIHERPIMRPRRSRKVRNDSLKENKVELHRPEITEPDSESKSPVLPWKKDTTDDVPPKAQLFMSTPPHVSTSTVLKLVTSLKSSMFDNSSPEDVTTPEEDSSSSSTSDDIDDDSSNSSTSSFSVRTFQAAAGVYDSNKRDVQPISWEPHGRWLNKDTEEESTRHFGILNSRQHLDKAHHWSRSGVNVEVDLMEQRSKLKKLTKQLNVAKRKVEDFEAQFEDSFGYRPSQAEKQSNKMVRKLLIQQSRLKRQIRLCRESGDSGIVADLEDDLEYSWDQADTNRPLSPSDFANVLNVYSDSSNDASKMAFESIQKNVERIKSVVTNIEDYLNCDREERGRPFNLEDMSHEQVVQEKNCIQSALSQFQSALNQSATATEEEKAALKDLMHRYRSVKRLIRRSSNLINKDSCELETIPEGSEIHLTLASPQHRINIEMSNGQGNLSPSRTMTEISSDLVTPSRPHRASTEEQNLHAMSRIELLNVQRMAKEEKKLLKRWIKEREVKFLDNFGRPMPKEEIKVHENYGRYKMTKAKLKLVDALLSKYVCNISKY